jgi:RNA polymerase sigma factor (sigma-70 family)
VRAIATRFGRPGDAEFEDVEQAAYVGLLKALDGFDPGRGTEFSTYAFPVIVGEITRCIRESRAFKTTGRLQETARRAASAIRTLEARLGRSPTIAEVSAESGIDPERIVEAFGAAGPTLSLDDRALSRTSSDAGDEGGLLETVSLRQALGALRPRERAVIVLRFVAGFTQSEVAHRLGISQPQVSREERSAIGKLRRMMS